MIGTPKYHAEQGLALVEGMMRFCVTCEGSGIIVRWSDLCELRDRFEALRNGLFVSETTSSGRVS